MTAAAMTSSSSSVPSELVARVEAGRRNGGADRPHSMPIIMNTITVTHSRLDAGEVRAPPDCRRWRTHSGRSGCGW